MGSARPSWGRSMKQEIQAVWADDVWPLSFAVCWIATAGDVTKFDEFNRQCKESMEACAATDAWLEQRQKIQADKSLSSEEQEIRLAAIGKKPERLAEPSASFLEEAATALVRAIKKGQIVAHGVKVGERDGLPQPVPMAHFTNAAPFVGDIPDELLFGEHEDQVSFLHWQALTEAHPGGSRGDCIMSRSQVIWMRITVCRREVQKEWPAPKKPGERRRPGKPGDLRERVKAAMRRDWDAGIIDLPNEKQVALEARYGCNRGTAVAARKAVLSEHDRTVSGK